MSTTVKAPTLAVKASTKHQKISAYKLRRVANVVRGKQVDSALAILKTLPHKGAALIEKVLKSAIANATHNFGLPASTLVLSEIMINEGPHGKRFQPRARGRIYKILKRTAHINLCVSQGPNRTGGNH